MEERLRCFKILSPNCFNTENEQCAAFEDIWMRIEKIPILRLKKLGTKKSMEKHYNETAESQRERVLKSSHEEKKRIPTKERQFG